MMSFTNLFMPEHTTFIRLDSGMAGQRDTTTALNRATSFICLMYCLRRTCENSRLPANFLDAKT